MMLIGCSSVAMAQGVCKVKSQDGDMQAYWCNKNDQKATKRCYADVEYADGRKEKIWGQTCYDSYADCWWSGKGAVKPDCQE